MHITAKFDKSWAAPGGPAGAPGRGEVAQVIDIEWEPSTQPFERPRRVMVLWNGQLLRVNGAYLDGWKVETMKGVPDAA